MSAAPRPGGARVGLEVVRVAVGAVELLFPQQRARADLGHAPDGVTVGAFRVLGVRQMVQGVLTARSGAPVAHALGGTTDTLHALSMVALAVLDRPRRRAAIVQGAVATLLATAEFMAARRR